MTHQLAAIAKINAAVLDFVRPTTFRSRRFFGVNCPIRVSSPGFIGSLSFDVVDSNDCSDFFRHDIKSIFFFGTKPSQTASPTMQAAKRCKNYFISKVKLFHKQITGAKQSPAEENEMKKFLMKESRVKKHINLTMARFKSFSAVFGRAEFRYQLWGNYFQTSRVCWGARLV